MTSITHLHARLQPAPLSFGHWDGLWPEATLTLFSQNERGSLKAMQWRGPRGVLGSLEPVQGHQVSEQGLPRQLHGEGTSPLGQLERRAIRFYSGDSIFFLLHQINTNVTPLTTRELLLIWKSDPSDFLAFACSHFIHRSEGDVGYTDKSPPCMWFGGGGGGPCWPFFF